MLTVTMHDIYPRPSWNYVFGLANLTARTGVFSFKRYDPSFWDLHEENRPMVLLKNSCHVMVHEIGHMYGIKHCIYYNCTMNGYNSYDESRRSFHYLCPLCLRKLSRAIGFKVSDWFSKMRTACAELGFDEDFEFYDRIIALESEEK
jgi:archaemetzincin